MYRRLFVIGSFVTLGDAAHAQSPWTLVTPDEVARDLLEPHPPQLRTRGMAKSGSPEIVVEQPPPAAVLHPPLNIRVRFVPAPGASINTATFRATYGFLGIDITDRLLRHAQLDGQQLLANNVVIPAGTHKVTLTIGDLQGRENSRAFEFTVT